MNITDTLLSVSGVLGGKSGGGEAPTLIAKAITENGTYAAEDDNADGYSEVTVDVAGLPDGFTVCATGTFTQTSAANSKTITHNLGVVPKLFVVFMENDTWYFGYNTYMLGIAVLKAKPTSDDQSVGVIQGNMRVHSTANANQVSGGNQNPTISATTAYISRPNAGGRFVPSQYTNSDETESETVTYRWYAFA